MKILIFDKKWMMNNQFLTTQVLLRSFCKLDTAMLTIYYYSLDIYSIIVHLFIECSYIY